MKSARLRFDTGGRGAIALTLALYAFGGRDHRYVHHHGTPGHGADHLLPAFISPTLTLPVFGGRVSLGTWQSIALVDPNVDNPHREIVLAFLRSADA